MCRLSFNVAFGNETKNSQESGIVEAELHYVDSLWGSFYFSPFAGQQSFRVRHERKNIGILTDL
jgi:hypothetical protein